MTTRWTTKADAEGRLTAAHKQVSLRQHHKKADKKLNQQVCAESHPHPVHKEVQQGLGLAENEHKPTDYVKALADIYVLKKTKHKQLISGEFMWDGGMGGALLLGEAGVDGRSLPQLQSLLHTFQQAPATGRPGVYLTTGLNGP